MVARGRTQRRRVEENRNSQELAARNEIQAEIQANHPHNRAFPPQDYPEDNIVRENNFAHHHEENLANPYEGNLAPPQEENFVDFEEGYLDQNIDQTNEIQRRNFNTVTIEELDQLRTQNLTDGLIIDLTKRGNIQFLYEGFTYAKGRSDRIRCSKKSKCPGLAKYASGFFSLLTNHVCKPNIPGQKAAIELKKLLNDAKTSNTSTREIVTNSLRQNILILNLTAQPDLKTVY